MRIVPCFLLTGTGLETHDICFPWSWSHHPLLLGWCYHSIQEMNSTSRWITVHISTMLTVQYLLEPPQVCILRHRRTPPWVYCLPTWHHYGPPQGSSYHRNSTTMEFVPTLEPTRKSQLSTSLCPRLHHSRAWFPSLIESWYPISMGWTCPNNFWWFKISALQCPFDYSTWL